MPSRVFRPRLASPLSKKPVSGSLRLTPESLGTDRESPPSPPRGDPPPDGAVAGSGLISRRGAPSRRRAADFHPIGGFEAARAGRPDPSPAPAADFPPHGWISGRSRTWVRFGCGGQGEAPDATGYALSRIAGTWFPPTRAPC